ncbi:MAG: hypothetical protein D6785_02570, partial [Planctomycetota bacterium]
MEVILRFRHNTTHQIFSLEASKDIPFSTILLNLLDQHPELKAKGVELFWKGTRIQPHWTISTLEKEHGFTLDQFLEIRPIEEESTTIRKLSSLATSLEKGAAPRLAEEELAKAEEFQAGNMDEMEDLLAEPIAPDPLSDDSLEIPKEVLHKLNDEREEEAFDPDGLETKLEVDIDEVRAHVKLEQAEEKLEKDTKSKDVEKEVEENRLRGVRKRKKSKPQIVLPEETLPSQEKQVLDHGGVDPIAADASFCDVMGGSLEAEQEEEILEDTSIEEPSLETAVSAEKPASFQEGLDHDETDLEEAVAMEAGALPSLDMEEEMGEEIEAKEAP